MNEENKNIKNTIDTVTGLFKAVPIYDDAIQPAAKEIGQSLKTVAKTLNVALAPIKALVWGYDKIEEFINTKVLEKLKAVPEEFIITPDPQIAGPALEALKYTGYDNQLRELFANLLATAMNKNIAEKIHPGYVEVIKNLSSDEALILKEFDSIPSHPALDLVVSREFHRFTLFNEKSALQKKIIITNFCRFNNPNIKFLNQVPVYIDNLVRLGLIYITYGELSIGDGLNMNQISYEDLEKELSKIHSTSKYERELEVSFERKVVDLTNYGKSFIENVVTEQKNTIF